MCGGYVRICTETVLRRFLERWYRQCAELSCCKHKNQATLDRFMSPVLFHADLLQCLQDGCTGSYRFEVATSLVLLFVNRFEENEAADDIDSE
jgi:hypothetical protein